MKSKKELLNATKVLIEASSEYRSGLIEIKEYKNRPNGSLVVYPKTGKTLHPIEIIRYVLHPLSGYIDYNYEEDRCELVIF